MPAFRKPFAMEARMGVIVGVHWLPFEQSDVSKEKSLASFIRRSGISVFAPISLQFARAKHLVPDGSTVSSLCDSMFHAGETSRQDETCWAIGPGVAVGGFVTYQR